MKAVHDVGRLDFVSARAKLMQPAPELTDVARIESFSLIQDKWGVLTEPVSAQGRKITLRYQRA